MPYYLIFKVFHCTEKLKRKIIIPFLRPFAKNDIFLLYIVFFHKLQKVYKKVYKNGKNIFYIFALFLLTKNIIHSILWLLDEHSSGNKTQFLEVTLWKN